MEDGRHETINSFYQTTTSLVQYSGTAGWMTARYVVCKAVYNHPHSLPLGPELSQSSYGKADWLNEVTLRQKGYMFNWSSKSSASLVKHDHGCVHSF